MEGLSQDSYNVGAYYQNHGLSLNVVYNWRSKYVYSAVGAESNTEWARPQGYLYASVSYDFNDNVGLTIQIRQRAEHLYRLCAETDIEVGAAALQFPLAHPAVSSVVAGMRSAAEVDSAIARMKSPVPPSAWRSLRDAGLLLPEAPTP